MASRSILAALPPSLSVATASRNGRPPKAGERYPSGKLKPGSGGPRPAEVRRMLDVVRAVAKDSVLASAVGWLRIHDVILDVDVSAAASYAALKAQYDQVMGTPSRSARSPSYQIGLGYQPPEENDDQIAHAAKVRKRYAAALTCLDNAKQRELLDRVCVDDEHPTAWEMTDLKRALDLLARHFKLNNAKAG